jgi:type IV secretory pathway TrbF-like protein
MALSLKGTPGYEDQLVAWHNQRLWWALIGACVLLGFALADIAIRDFRPAPPPPVLEVNSKGEPLGQVEPLETAYGSIKDQVTRYAVSTFIGDAFRISPNFDEEKTILARVYAMSSGQAANALTSYYHTEKLANPLSDGTKVWQAVKVTRTLALPVKDTYQIDYTTSRHTYAYQDPVVTTNWRATLRVVNGQPTPDNQLGLFVTSLDFAPEAK